MAGNPNAVAVYHERCKRMREKLAANAPADGVLYIVSKEDEFLLAKGGQVSAVTLHNAARCIVEQTHELATPAQVEFFHAENDRRTQEYALIEAKRNKQTVIMLPNTDPAMLQAQAAASVAVRKGKD